MYVEIFANFAACSHWQKFYYTNFLSCVKDYIEDMATFAASIDEKFIPPNFSAIQRQLGLVKFYPAKIFTYYTVNA